MTAVRAYTMNVGVEASARRATFHGALMPGRGTLFLQAELGEDGAYHSTVSDVCPWEHEQKIAAAHLGPYLARGDRYAVRA